jgi:hypothetical protein
MRIFVRMDVLGKEVQRMDIGIVADIPRYGTSSAQVQGGHLCED